MLCHVTMSGRPFERGRQHGEQVGHQVEKAVRFHKRHSAEEAPEVRREVQRIEGVLRRRWPDTIEEMQGIAAGANLPYEDILLLNVFYEVEARPRHRCTTIGLPRTPNGPLLGKTDDLSLELGELETFFRVEPEGGHACIYYAIAGTLWAVAGVNELGLAQVMTGLAPARVQNPDGIPGDIFYGLVLRHCRTVEEALALAESQPILRWGHTLTLAHSSSDEVVVIENYPTARQVQRSSDEPLVRTNHCLLPQTTPLMRSKEEQEAFLPGIWDNSHNRYENAARLVREIPRSVEGLKRFLGDHTIPGAICQHGQTELHTSLATVLMPRRRAMIAAEGYGCGPYQEWTV